MIKPYSIGAILLAAGSSKRMGSVNKLLLEIDGVPMIKKSIKPFVNTNIKPIVVVTGFESERVKSCLMEYELQFVYNSRFEEGMGASLAVGAASLSSPNLDGIMISLGDLPYVREGSMRSLLAAFETCNANRIVVPSCRGKQGHPITFPIRYLEELRKLKGDVGARNLIRRDRESIVTVELDDIGIAQDVDEPFR